MYISKTILIGTVVAIIFILFGVRVYARRDKNSDSETMIAIGSIVMGVLWFLSSVLGDVLSKVL